VLVELIDSGITVEEIQRQMPSEIPIGALESFERIGRNLIVPALLIAEYAAAPHIRKLPIEKQEQILKSGCSILIMNNGSPDTLRCDVRDMTSSQCRQVFEGDHVRSISQQRMWIESEKARKSLNEMSKAVTEVTPYTIHGKKVIFSKGCEMTQQQVAMLLAQLSA